MSRPGTNPITTAPNSKPWSGRDKYQATLERKSTQSSYYRGNGHWLSHYPRLVAEWHPNKNGSLKPEDVSHSSAKRIWWKCPHGSDHEWSTPPSKRTVNNGGCPFCSHKRLSVTNSLAAVAPEVAAQWHPTKNWPVKPAQVIAGSAKQVWWKCPVSSDHLWKAQVCKRVYEGSGCPACEGFLVSRTNSLATTNPELAKQWHPTRNGKLTPNLVVAGSTQVVWWKCPEGRDHIWKTPLRERGTLGKGCPMCANRKPAASSRLSTQCPALAKEWHPKKNGELLSKDLVTGSKRLVWWQCEHGHEWQAPVVSRVKGVGCPECSPRKLNETTNLAAARPDLAAQWHPTKNGKLTPRDVHHRGASRVWWKCPQGPDHEWETALHSRSKSNGTCPFCRGMWLSVTNSLATLRPALAAEWDFPANAPVTPADVTAGTKLRVAWRCSVDPSHQWSAPVSERNRGAGKCPRCRSARVRADEQRR